MEAKHLKIIDLQQGSPEWLEYRSNKIGASDAPSIMGVGYDTPYQLWQYKLGIAKKPQTAAMRRGQELESEARYSFALQTGIHVEPVVLESIERPWQIASLDGISSNGRVAVEIKHVRKELHEAALKGEVPKIFFPQLQHIMLVANLDRMYYFSRNGESEKILEVSRDENYCSELIEKEAEFYKRLQNFEPPQGTHDEFEQRDADSDWVRVATEWRAVWNDLEALKKKEEDYRNALITLANNRNSEGAGIRLQKIFRKGAVDYSKIPELAGVDLEKYRKKGIESYRLSCTYS